ncbi:alpha/beta fold hydrolase, partial [Kibdelosporangium lantanae]
FFSTDQRVADFDAVRQKLGVPSLMLYGTSYGSVDVAAYASRYPTRTSAVVVDSPLVSGNDGYLTGYTYQEFLKDGQRVYAEPCQASRACRTVHPDPVGELADLARLLRAHPDPVVPLATIDPLMRYTSGTVNGRDHTADVLKVRKEPDVKSAQVGSYKQNAQVDAEKVVQNGYRRNDEG